RLAELAGVLSDYISLCKEQFAFALPASDAKGNQPFDRRRCADHERQAPRRTQARKRAAGTKPTAPCL
ncbi:MAG: hypothetical protein KKH37_01870, partial [Alphaproteobacteria bacterium]|nr:hypothetical protein [Alphaproteobacteria bacterium]